MFSYLIPPFFNSVDNNCFVVSLHSQLPLFIVNYIFVTTISQLPSTCTRLRPALTKNPKDKALKRQNDIEESKIPILPAVIMLHRAKSFDFNNVRARNK